MNQPKPEISILTTVQIGKNGLTDGILGEINKQLQKKKSVKIKFLNSYIKGKDKKQEAQKLADLTHSYIKQRIGFTVVLCKR